MKFAINLLIVLVIIGIILLLPIDNIYAKDKVEQLSLQFITFKDPENRFTIDYPLDWNVESNRHNELLGPTDTALLNSKDRSSASVLFDIVFRDMETLSRLYEEYDLTSTEALSTYAFVFSQKELTKLENYELMKSQITKYEIDGYPSNGLIYGFKDAGEPKYALLLFSFLDRNKIIGINYISNQYDFDDNMEIIEKMIQSIQILQ